MGLLEGKVAIISGATSGIGKATKELFEKEGAVCIGFGSEICDISKESSIKNFFEEVKSKYKRVDVLINNAGIYPYKKLDEITEDDFEKTFDINVKGTMLMCKYFMPMLIESKGVIVNNSSIAGMDSYIQGKGSYLYASSKASVIQFSKLLAKNYAPNVRVNVVCPGITDTNIYTDKNLDRYISQIPLSRIATAEDIAKAILFLSSELSSYITGVVLPVDGGMSI